MRAPAALCTDARKISVLVLRTCCLCVALCSTAISNAAARAPCDPPPEARHIPVGDFNTAADGQNDDGPALRAAIKEAVNAQKPAVIELQPGKTYRITSAEETYSLGILGGKQIIVQGNGAELSLLPPNKAMRIENSSDIAVCGLTIDYAPLPFTQGTVASVDPRAGTFELAIEDGYDVPDVDAPAVESNRRAWRFAVPFGPDGKHDRRVEINAVYAGSAPRQIRIKPVRSDDVARLIPNQTRLIMTKPMMSQIGGFAFRVTGSERVNFQSVRIYSVPRMTFVISNNLGPVSLDGVEQRRRPGTTRLMTGWQDIFHAINNRGPVTIENCYTDRISDDAINFSAIFQQVVEKIDDQKWRLRDLSVADDAPPMRVGDRLQAIDLTPQRRIIGETRIVSVTQNGGETVLTTSSALPLTPASTCNEPRPERGGTVCGTRVMDLDAANENSLIRGCTIHGSVRLRSKTTLENSTIDGPLAISADPIRVGPLPNGTVIRNNHLSGVIRIGPDNTERDKYNVRWDSGERWARNISFENNEIESVFRADGAAFSSSGDNLVWPAIRRFFLQNSGPVQVKGLKEYGEPARLPVARFKLGQGTLERDVIIGGGDTREQPAPPR